VHHRSISPLAGPLLDRLLERASADERLLGITLGGSAASGLADEHSDLDLVLVCRDDDHPALLATLPALARDIGPLLSAFTGEHVGEPRLLIALYGPPLLHVDLKLVARRDLAARVEDGLLLWERGRTISDGRATAAASWPQPDLQWIEDRFWVWVHYCSGKIARGELLECIDALAGIRGMVLGPLLAVQAGARPQGVRRLEQIAPRAMAQLVATIGAHDAGACVAALRATATLYRELRDDLDGGELVRRADAERHALEHLDAVARDA